MYFVNDKFPQFSASFYNRLFVTHIRFRTKGVDQTSTLFEEKMSRIFNEKKKNFGNCRVSNIYQ